MCLLISPESRIDFHNLTITMRHRFLLMCHFIRSWRYFDSFTVLEHLKSLLTNRPLGQVCWKINKILCHYSTLERKFHSQLRETGDLRCQRIQDASIRFASRLVSNDHIHSILKIKVKAIPSAQRSSQLTQVSELSVLTCWRHTKDWTCFRHYAQGER